MDPRSWSPGRSSMGHLFAAVGAQWPPFWTPGAAKGGTLPPTFVSLIEGLTGQCDPQCKETDHFSRTFLLFLTVFRIQIQSDPH